MNISAVQVQFFGNLLVGQVQPHEIQTQYPYLEGLMMSSEDGACKVIKPFAAIFTFITLSGRFFFIKTPFDYSFGITIRTLTSFRPAQLPNSVVTLRIINQSLYVYLYPLDPYGELGQKVHHLTFQAPDTQHEPIKICFNVSS